MLTRDHKTQFTCHPHVYPQPQSITALWPVGLYSFSVPLGVGDCMSHIHFRSVCFVRFVKLFLRCRLGPLKIRRPGSLNPRTLWTDTFHRLRTNRSVTALHNSRRRSSKSSAWTSAFDHPSCRRKGKERKEVYLYSAIYCDTLKALRAQ